MKSRPYRLVLAAGLLLVSVAPALAAGDREAGRGKARACAVCHGLDGAAKRPDVPNIGGESVIYLKKQLEAFRSGERRHEQMSIIAEGLSDQDIADVSAWYAAILFEVRIPE